MALFTNIGTSTTSIRDLTSREYFLLPEGTLTLDNSLTAPALYQTGVDRGWITVTGYVAPGNEIVNDPSKAPLASPVFTGVLKLPTVLKASLPTASTNTNAVQMVSNAVGGPALCFSNGTAWIDVVTGVAVA